MNRHGRTELVAVRCAFCGSEFFVRKESLMPKMYCTLRCIDLDMRSANIEETA